MPRRLAVRTILPLFLLLVACLYTFRFESPETRSWPAKSVARISAQTVNGRVDVTSAADTLIFAGITRYAYGRNHDDAEKALVNVVVSDTIIGSELRLVASMPTSGSRPYGASFAISAPESTGLDLNATNGGITVDGIAGSINAGTTNGKISLTDTRGAAVLGTTNGEITTSGHSGSIDAQTTNGAVRLDIASLLPSEGASVGTTNAAVELFLPADVSATLDLTNTNGSISLYDFGYAFQGTPSDHHVRALIGTGTSVVTVTTTNGDITIRRR